MPINSVDKTPQANQKKKKLIHSFKVNRCGNLLKAHFERITCHRQNCITEKIITHTVRTCTQFMRIRRVNAEVAFYTNQFQYVICIELQRYCFLVIKWSANAPITSAATTIQKKKK